MNLLKNMRTAWINPAQVNFQNLTFSVPSFDVLEPLKASVEQVGILNPPVVKSDENTVFIPILGRRRLQVAATLKFESVEVRIADSSLNNEDGYLMAFWDNLARIKQNPAVKANAIKRLLELFPRETIAKNILPFIETPARGPKLERLRKIGGLENDILEAMSNGRIQEKSAILFAELPPNDRQSLFKVVCNLGLNSNKAFEIISGLFDLSIFWKKPITDLLSDSDAVRILDDPVLSAQEKASEFRDLLKSWKYPYVHEKQMGFEGWAREINPADYIRLRPAQSFEDDSVSIEIRLDSRTEAEKFLTVIDQYKKETAGKAND
jgi:ParB-like chromosome segregation protein Spo0J